MPILAAVGLIFLLFAAPLYWANLRCETYSPYSHHYANSAATKPNGAPKNATGIPRKSAIQRVADALEALNQKPPSEDEQRNAKAQEYLVCWTPWVFGVALGEMLITLAGVILVFATLKYTRDLFEDQKAATQVAREAVATARAQVRADLTIESVKLSFGPDGDQPTVTIKIPNSGQSRAKHFIWAVTIQYIYADFSDITDPTAAREGKAIFDFSNRPGLFIPANTASEDSLFVPNMSIRAFTAGQDEYTERFIVRTRLEFSYLDVFHQRTEDEAYFSGMAEFRRADPGGGMAGWQCQMHPGSRPTDWGEVHAMAMG